MLNTLLRRRHGISADTLTLAAFMLLTGCYWVGAQDAPPQTAPEGRASPSQQTPVREGEPPTPSGKNADPPREEDDGTKIAPALDGYSPVAYLLEKKAAKGSREHMSVYRGEAYFLSSVEAKKMFDANPEKFLPRFGGLCATALGGSYGNKIPADPSVFMVYKDKVYLFSSDRAKRAFEKSPDWFIARAEPLYEDLALDGRCVVSYQTRNMVVEGRPNVTTEFRGQTYRFANRRARAAFLADPQRYLPQYNGCCAEGLARNKLYPGDPDVFVVLNDRTFFLFDEKAKMRFVVNPMDTIKKADAKWATFKEAGSAP